MYQVANEETRTNLAGYPVSPERWKELSSSIRITKEQEQIYLELKPLFHMLKQVVAAKYGAEMAEQVIGSLVPGIALYPPEKPREFERIHPAAFDLREAIDHIELLTKPKEVVLDIMTGSGTTLEAAYRTGRYAGGIELMDHWYKLAEQRLSAALGGPFQNGMCNLYLKQGDCREILPEMKPKNIDLVLFSPPYFDILRNPTGPRAQHRKRLGLPVNYGSSPKELGSIHDYGEFMSEMQKVCSGCYQVLKKGKYMVVIVADIRSRGKFVPYHADFLMVAQSVGFQLNSIQVVMDQWKRKYFYGAPKSGLLSFHHHYALIFQKV